MATYKVIQDVEAEDKLLGPLTLRQFIYAGVSAINLYLCWFASTHHATFLIAIFLPIALIMGFFAFPWGRDQPTEIWALAKIRYMLKPRRRIWDQSGAKDLVTVTAPKQVHVDYTNGLSQDEVKSRLHALADTIDSRGWAIKNSNLNLYSQPALVMAEPTSDRLLNPSSLPQQVSDIDVHASDDILDEKNNARAQAVDSMIERSAKAHRAQIEENLKNNTPPQPPAPPAPQQAQAGANGSQGATGQGAMQNGQNPANGNYRSNDYWFLNQPTRSANIPANMVTFNTQVVTPGMNNTAAAQNDANADEQSLARALAARQQEMPTTAYYSHLHTVQPLSAQQQQRQAAQAAPVQLPPQPAPAVPTESWQGTSDIATPAEIIAAAQRESAANAQTPQPAPAMPSNDMGVAQAVANGMAPAWPQQPQAMPPQQAQGTPGMQPVPTIARPWEPTQNPAAPPVTPASQAAILQLANNNDLSVATLAREADQAASDEVVIKLH